jgi:hypothetical protein
VYELPPRCASSFGEAYPSKRVGLVVMLMRHHETTRTRVVIVIVWCATRHTPAPPVSTTRGEEVSITSEIVQQLIGRYVDVNSFLIPPDTHEHTCLTPRMKNEHSTRIQTRGNSKASYIVRRYRSTKTVASGRSDKYTED